MTHPEMLVVASAFVACVILAINIGSCVHLFLARGLAVTVKSEVHHYEHDADDNDDNDDDDDRSDRGSPKPPGDPSNGVDPEPHHDEPGPSDGPDAAANRSPALPVAELVPAYRFDCDSCGTENIIRTTSLMMSDPMARELVGRTLMHRMDAKLISWDVAGKVQTGDIAHRLTVIPQAVACGSCGTEYTAKFFN